MIHRPARPVGSWLLGPERHHGGVGDAV